MALIDSIFLVGFGMCLAVLIFGIWFDVLKTMK